MSAVVTVPSLIWRPVMREPATAPLVEPSSRHAAAMAMTGVLRGKESVMRSDAKHVGPGATWPGEVISGPCCVVLSGLDGGAAGVAAAGAHLDLAGLGLLGHRDDEPQHAAVVGGLDA